MVKGGGDMVVNWIWRICNMAFENVLHWFVHIERIRDDRITKRMYMGKSVGTRLVVQSRKRWIV